MQPTCQKSVHIVYEQPTVQLSEEKIRNEPKNYKKKKNLNNSRIYVRRTLTEV